MTRLVRTGEAESWSAAEEPVTENLGQPAIYGHVIQLGRLSYRWRITAGDTVLAAGKAFTEGGAWVKAVAAAHRPSLRAGGAR